MIFACNNSILKESIMTRHVIIFAVFTLLILLLIINGISAEFYVAVDGADSNPGTIDKPFKTIHRAQTAARNFAGKEPVTVFLKAGTYYLDSPLVFTGKDSGTSTAPVKYSAMKAHTVIISGGKRLNPKWQKSTNNIVVAQLPAGLKFDQLFVNGQRQIMARYPDYDPNVRIFNGYSKDALSPLRAARWSNPIGGYIHAMHRALWGDFHYIITGKKENGELIYEGGWQNNRRMGMHSEYRFVENILEELDAQGEWYFDPQNNKLFFIPPAGLDLNTAIFEVATIPHLIEFRGEPTNPVKFITLNGIIFSHTTRTFMENKEPLLRSDWTIYRGGAVFLTGTENIAVENCIFDQLGGNAVFVNNYNRRVKISGCHIYDVGANGIAFVGDPQAVRNPLFEYNQRHHISEIDMTPGPKSNNYPSDCLVEECLIERIGRVEKQTAGVQISMSKNITVRHCSIYDVPRAGVNIGDGCWGGHIIEYCDVFNTVLETGDHGSFNSWGRDRYWELRGIDLNTITTNQYARLPILDVIDKIIIRNNRWRCDHGWDIDLDDGSSNYEIRNNLCLNGGIKLREGFYRICENNIMVNNTFHPHVWYKNSQDIFRYNIVFSSYRPIRVNKPWGKECDNNFLHRPGLFDILPATVLQQQSGMDANSIETYVRFIDPSKGDYRVKEDSPVLKRGFVNFQMDKFGVTRPNLKAIAKTPILPNIKVVREDSSAHTEQTIVEWRGLKLKKISGLGDISAAGLPEEIGFRIEDITATSELASAGLRAGDVIIGCNGKQIRSIEDLNNNFKIYSADNKIRLEIWREQKTVIIEIKPESLRK